MTVLSKQREMEGEMKRAVKGSVKAFMHGL